MVTDEFLENRIILQNSVASIGFIWFFWFQKCILLYILVQVFLVIRCIRSHISFFRLGLTPTLNDQFSTQEISQLKHYTSFANMSKCILECDLYKVGFVSGQKQNWFADQLLRVVEWVALIRFLFGMWHYLSTLDCFFILKIFKWTIIKRI